MPFKTGIFLHGEPGTGKSSIIKAIASYFSLDIYYLNLTELGYNEFKAAVNGINRWIRDEPVIVSLEEIDISNEAPDDIMNDKNKKLSLLLNWLDGQESPDNVIFIATTNYYDKVDERIKRSGRFDYTYNITNITKDMAIKMCRKFEIEPKEILELEEFKNQKTYSPSKLQEYLLKKVVVGNES